FQGEETSPSQEMTPRERRTQLLMSFLQAPVPQPEKKDPPVSSGRGYHGMYDKMGFERGVIGMMELDRPERDTPESVKKLLSTRPLIQLPKNATPLFTKRAKLKAPYTLPTVKKLKGFLFNRISIPIEFTIPQAQPGNIQVRPPKVNPMMEMTPGGVAYQMVKAGLQPSEMAEKYQANWSAEKVSRDILQNFFDSHGQTLEGVQFKIIPVWSDSIESTGGKKILTYKVQIIGLGQYDYEKSYILGASDKQDDDHNAGGYGEGLKIIALNLLRDYGAKYVKVSSANWAMTYSLPEGQNAKGHTPKLYNQLEHLAKAKEQLPGNVFEFQTDNVQFIETLMKATQYFYHPYNPDFQQQTYENEVGGFKILPSGQKGNVYVAMQRYEYANKGAWEAHVPGITIWKRTKAEKSKIDRDRTHLSSSEVSDVLSAICKKMLADEVVHTIQVLEPYLGENYDSMPLLYTLRDALQYTHRAKMEFPPKFLADNLSSISDRLKRSSYKESEFLKKKGYILCRSDFGNIGMTLASDVLQEEKPDAFKSAVEKDQDEEKLVKGEYAKKSSPKIELSPGEKVRFHALSSCLKALGSHFSGGSKLYQFRDATLVLGEKNQHDSEYNFQTHNSQSVFTVDQNTLRGGFLEKALFQLMTTAILKHDTYHSSSTYTYTLTDLSIALAKAFVTSPELRECFNDCRALWELSGRPEVMNQISQAALSQA
ncbi:MAG: hypothetical protein K2X66_15350, partial [Cyanobacteria bacterium]|nr:hypothetical protein [Cyanobacteriota bacterium]